MVTERREETPVVQAAPEQVYDGRQQQATPGVAIPRIALWTNMAVHWSIFAVLLLIGFAVPGFLVVAFGWLFLPAIGISIPRMITPLLIQTYTCPGCHEEYPSVNVWNCTCGFHDHKERHILRFKCPLCGKRFNRTDCLRCGATIRLW